MLTQSFVRVLAFLILVLLPFGVLAQQRDRNVVLLANQTVNGTYFGAGDNVRIDGTVNGDAYVAGGTVNVNGQINGDLLIAGGTINIRGQITQDIRAAGGTIIISGDVGRNITVGGGTITIERGANVRGGIVAGGGTISLMGPIDHDVTIGAGTIVFGDKIGGNAQINAETITLASSAAVSGNFSYMSQREIQIDQGASVSGKIDRQPVPIKQQERQSKAGGLIGMFIWGKILSLAAMYLIGFLLITIMPRTTKHMVNTVENRIWKSAGMGILILLVSPFIMIFLMTTIIGIPFAIYLLFWYILTLYVGKIFVAIYLGRWAANKVNKKVTDVWALFLGLVLHLIITLIPVIGWFAGLFTMLWGAGALFLTKKELYHSYRKKDLL